MTIVVRHNLKCDLDKTHHRTKHPVLQTFCNSLLSFDLEDYSKIQRKHKIKWPLNLGFVIISLKFITTEIFPNNLISVLSYPSCITRARAGGGASATAASA